MSFSRKIGIALTVAMAVLIGGACVQQSNTYPIDIFTDMHYSQSYRVSEPDRPDPVGDAVTIDHYGNPAGDPEAVLDVNTVLSNWSAVYSATATAPLYTRYCASCHGTQGLGDGPVAAHFTHPQSYFVTANNASAPYIGPANLQDTRQNLDKETVYQTILNGRNGMPNFKHLSERTIRALVEYIYDDAAGLGS